MGLEPGAAVWKAQTNPLSYDGTLSIANVFCCLGHLKISFYYPTSHMRARG